MSLAVRRRFDETWQMAFSPSVGAAESAAVKASGFERKHARSLLEHGIAVAAAGPGPLHCVPFTVLEEKDGGFRQRFILWTKEGNRLAEEAGYQADVPLQHISKYLGVVREECASTRDFRTGFYAVEIPKESRHLFRFVDDGGDWWELTRLPMGHTCAPELMHTLAATAAGHPSFVRPEFAERAVVVDIWIDNIRYAGSRSEVTAATARLERTASDCVLTWKEQDTRTAVQTYEFLGVSWNHGCGEVALSEKLVKRLEKTRAELSRPLEAHELESLGGRLLHASAVAGVFPGAYWFALKFLRRVTNSLNRGTRAASDTVVLSPCVRATLVDWISAVLRPRRMPSDAGRPSFTAFVDASLLGWGGVLVDVRTSEVTILGAPWTEQERRLHINVLEAMAFEKVVLAIPESVAGGRVDVVVDNTTVKGVARKGSCVRDPVLNRAVVQGLERMRFLGCALSVRWVKSADNPADLPSRVPLTSLTRGKVAAMELAVRRFLTRDVAGGK
ncbi:hypothetical protein DIPPA_03063 [Diplonema papillatum]|nr:hypothetical protein DIPPA_03063 [Diplonema papillatum]